MASVYGDGGYLFDNNDGTNTSIDYSVFRFPFQEVTINANHNELHLRGGVYYLKARTEHRGQTANHTHYYFQFKNDPDKNDVSVNRIEREVCSYLRSGGSRVVISEGGDDYWLIKMPTEFIFNNAASASAGISGVPKVKHWQVGGTYAAVKTSGGVQVGTHIINVKGFMPERSYTYATRFTQERTRFNPSSTAQGDVLNVWVQELNTTWD